LVIAVLACSIVAPVRAQAPKPKAPKAENPAAVKPSKKPAAKEPAVEEGPVPEDAAVEAILATKPTTPASACVRQRLSWISAIRTWRSHF